MANGTNPQEAWTTTGSTGGVLNEFNITNQLYNNHNVHV